MKKWVVTIYAEDGVTQKSYLKLVDAVRYMEKQSGVEIKIDGLQNWINVSGSYRVSDSWGRTFELHFVEIGTCKVCEKKDIPLLTLVLSPIWHDIPKEYEIAVCLDCVDDYECGVWGLKYEKGKYNVINRD